MSTRSQLRERIRQSSLDEVVLEEMIRHGFWGRDQAIPDLPQDFFERRRELQSEIQDILTRDRRLANPDLALQEIMKERMREARLKRVETKRKEIEARNARGLAFDKKRRENVLSLGDSSSAPLHKTDADLDLLLAQDLPLIDDALSLSEAMGIGLPELKFLTYDRRVANQTHYQSFEIPKKTGGTRQIFAPKPRMKRAQYWILDNILNDLPLHDAAHGFREGRSIVTNAQPHVGQQLVINMDLKDFFPTITYPRVKGLFASMGYAEADAALLALICTEADREPIEIDGQTWHVAMGPRKTPQGAPTSPAIANLVTRKLDRRLTGLAKRFGLTYTRYADDLSFSGDMLSDQGLKGFHAAAQAIVADEGFVIHPDKTRFMRRGDRQEVTGLVVNDKVSVPREERRKFRAWLHQVGKTGQPTRPFRTGNPVTSGQGYASFLYMVGGTEGLALAERAWQVLGRQTGVTAYQVEDAQHFRHASAYGRPPHPDWWQPQEPPAFVPIPLPKFARKDQKVESGQSNIPTAGSRNIASRHRRTAPADGHRSDAALRRVDHLDRLRPEGQGFSFVERLFRLILSLAAMTFQFLPALGTLIAVVLLYFIWKPPGGYKGMDSFWGAAKVWGKLVLGLITGNVIVVVTILILAS